MSAVVKAVEKVVDTVVKTVEAVISDPLPTLLTIAGAAVGIPPYVTQAAISAARGGDLEDIAKSAAIAYVAPKIAPQLAPSISNAVGSVVTNQAAAQALTAATSQSLVAGSLTAATGGDWQQAAAGSFAGSMAASGYDNYVAPEVMAQAKSLGLSAESHANIQNALKSSVASGTGAAAAGGDFATGFANAFVESGFEMLSAKADQGLQDMKKSFMKDKGMQDNEPTDAGIPDNMVAQVPESPEGKFAQKNSVSIEDQLAEINKTPRSAEYGQQFGPELAGLSGGVIPYGKATATDVPIDVPEVDFKPYVVSNQDQEKSLPLIEVTDKAYNPQKSAISGDFSDLIAATEFGKISPMGGGFEPNTGVLSSSNLNRILLQANQSSDAAVEAKAQAAISPTPENVAVAEQAQLAAELDQKVLADAQKQSLSEDVPPTGEVPPQSANVPVASNVPTQPAESAAPTIDQTNQRILYSILSGNATTGTPTPVQGSAVVDASGLSPLQQAGMADVQGAGGISDPIDGQTGKIGTLTGGTKAPGTGGSGLSLNAPSGGLQFSSFGRTGYAPQQTNLVGSLIPNLLNELNNQSLMMMSPEEYALRTQAGNIFRVARGGLITLKKQR
jgi:hypothetical protein